MERVNEGGNYCGHVPHSPDFAILNPAKIGRGGHPQILTKLMLRITEYYAQPRFKIPSLDQANDSQRQQRSERRESCLRLLGVIIKHTDLASMRIGQPTKEGFLSYDIKYLAREARLGLRRAERAMKDLVSSGLITTGKQPRELQADGSYKGLAKPRTVSPLLFNLFGLGEWLKHERKKASKRLDKLAKSKNTTRTQVTRFRLFTRSMANKLGMSNKASKKPKASAPVPSDEERQRALMILYGELKQANPTLTSNQIKERAEAILSAQSVKIA